MQTVPFIPDNAPFTPEQRSWLNGFLAGIYSSAAVAPTAKPPRSLKIAVLYGSQSGTAEGLARKLAKELKSKGHVASLNSLEGYTPAALLAERTDSVAVLAAVLLAAGMTNASDGGRVSLEALLRRPPDLLVVSTVPAYPSLATSLLEHPALAGLPRRAIPPALTICAGPFSAEAAAMLAR